MIAAVLSDEGSLSGSDPDADRARPDRGAPDRPMRLVAKGGAPGGAAPYVTGRARSRCTARGGYVIPASKGCLTQHPWRLPPLHLLARFVRDWQTSDALRRENAEARLFEIVDQETKARRFLNLAPLFRGERSARSAG